MNYSTRSPEEIESLIRMLIDKVDQLEEDNRRLRDPEGIPDEVKVERKDLHDETDDQFNDILLSLGELSPLDKKLSDILDVALKYTGAERGFILLLGADGEYDFRFAKTGEGEIIEYPDNRISRRAVRRALQSPDGLLMKNILESDWSSRSLRNIGALSIVCFPLYSGERPIGVIYLDHSKPVLNEKHLRLIRKIAAQSSLAIQNSRIYDILDRENAALKEKASAKEQTYDLIGNSQALCEVRRKIDQVAQAQANVLIEGETGTGKEIVAAMIHQKGSRRSGPFVPINCASYPDTLIDSALFGYARGAFTGAFSNHKGVFEQADKGVLFLDEIASMTLPAQAKLLRCLQEGKFRPIGSLNDVNVDVQIIAAANVNLKIACNDSSFREDLLYRLNQVTIKIPPLRHRTDDIPLLAVYFLNKANIKFGKNLGPFSHQTLYSLIRYPWPGNVRELQHFVDEIVILSQKQSGPIEPADFPRQLTNDQSTNTPPQSPAPHFDLPCSFDEKIRQFKTELLLQALNHSNGNKSKAARLLNVPENRIRYLVKALNLFADSSEKDE